MTAASEKPNPFNYVCPRCHAPRGLSCCYVTPLGFVQIDRTVRTHAARLAKAARSADARWRRGMGGKK